MSMKKVRGENKVFEYGKHKGKAITEVPDDYIWYVSQSWQDDKFGVFRPVATEEIRRRGLLQKAEIHNSDIRFGKYKGQPLSNVPDEYLDWILSEKYETHHQELRRKASIESKRRRGESD